MQERNSSGFRAVSRLSRQWLAFGAGVLLVSACLPFTAVEATTGVNWQPPTTASPYAVPRSEQRQLASARGDTYQIMISWPDGDAPPGGFPVIYVLDGNAVFGTLTETARRLTRPYGPDYKGLPAPVVVAIGYPGVTGIDRERRTFDYTPPAEQFADAGGMRLGSRQGGADLFLDFIEQTLKPAIEADFPIDRSHQILMGHSFGGLFVLHALFTRPQAFQSYVAVSPSIWWNDRHLLKEVERFAERQKHALARPRVQISLGEREQGGRSLAPDGRQSAAEFLANRLRGLEHGALDVSFRVHAGETHGSVVPVALARALPEALRKP